MVANRRLRSSPLPLPPPPLPSRSFAPSLASARTCSSSMTLEDSDRALIVKTLDQVGWVVGGPRGAAAKLGLKRTTLLAKMRRMGIARPIDQEGTDGFGMAPETIRGEDAQR